MSLSEVKQSVESRMGKSIETLKVGLSKIRTGRAHAGILDHVQVEYYGSPVPVSQVANINLLDARTISVQVWEKSMAGPVEKAIRDSARSEEHTSELQSLMRISYAVFCLQQNKQDRHKTEKNTI